MALGRSVPLRSTNELILLRYYFGLVVTLTDMDKIHSEQLHYFIDRSCPLEVTTTTLFHYWLSNIVVPAWKFWHWVMIYMTLRCLKKEHGATQLDILITRHCTTKKLELPCQCYGAPAVPLMVLQHWFVQHRGVRWDLEFYIFVIFFMHNTIKITHFYWKYNT